MNFGWPEINSKYLFISVHILSMYRSLLGIRKNVKSNGYNVQLQVHIKQLNPYFVIQTLYFISRYFIFPVALRLSCFPPFFFLSSLLFLFMKSSTCISIVYVDVISFLSDRLNWIFIFYIYFKSLIKFICSYIWFGMGKGLNQFSYGF